MNVNVNILTAGAQAFNDQTAAAYQDAIAAHIGGDWSGHNQVVFYGTVAYGETAVYNSAQVLVPGSRPIPNASALRIQLSGTNSDGSGDGAFICPAINSGIPVAVNGIVPAILLQPGSLAVAAGTTALFSVTVASGAPVTYQWYLGSSAIAGAVYSNYVVVAATAANAGSYTVRITNSYGSVTSAAATLTIS